MQIRDLLIYDCLQKEASRFGDKSLWRFSQCNLSGLTLKQAHFVPPPSPQAVCCSDGDHCCPSDYTCDSKRTSCTKGTLSVPWYRKEQSLAEDNAVADVKCDDKSSCASGATCCKLPTGEWGCCPLVKVAVAMGLT